MTNKKNWLLNGMCMVIIIILCLYRLADVNSISIIGDEFGYWSVGAYINGLDWSQLASCNMYYNFGYGLLLTPVVALFHNTEIMYLVALVINIVLLCLTYLLIVSTQHKLMKKEVENTELIYKIVALVITCYPTYLFYTHLTLAETFLLLLFWCVLYLVVCYVDCPGMRTLILICIVLITMSATHMRTLGIIVSAVCIIGIIDYRNKRFIEFTSLIVILSLGVILITMYKNNYQNTFLHAFDNADILSINDIGGQKENVKNLLSISGIKTLLITIWGKIYYVTCSTYFIAIVGCISIGKLMLGEKCKTTKSVAALFLFFSIGSTLLISCIFLQDYGRRIDLLIYGRYIEFTIGPLIMFGIHYLLEGKMKNQELLVIVASVVGMTFIGFHFFETEKTISNVFVNTFAISDLYGKINDSTFVIWAAMARAVVIILSIYMIISTLKKEKYKFYLLVCLSVTFVSIYINGIGNGYLAWAVPQTNEVRQMKELIMENNYQDDIVCLMNEERDISGAYLQYMLPNDSIECIMTYKELTTLDYEKLVLTTQNNLYDTYMEGNYELIYDSKVLKLWLHKDSVHLENYKLRKVKNSILDDMIFNNESLDTLSGGYYMFGPYLSLEKGTYQVELEYQMTGGDIGADFEVTINGGMNIIEREKLKFENNTASIKFTACDRIDNVEFRISLQANQLIKVKSIELVRENCFYTIGLNDNENVLKLEEILDDCGAERTISILAEDISTEYLTEKFYNTKIRIIENDIQYPVNSTIALMPIDDFGWHEILDRYTVIYRSEHYLWMVSNEVYVNMNDSKYKPLSESEWIAMDVFRKYEDANYSMTKYESMESGEYRLLLDTSGVEISSVSDYVVIYNGEKKIIKTALYDGMQEIQIVSEERLRDLHAILYQENKEIEIPIQSIAIVRDSCELEYALNFEKFEFNLNKEKESNWSVCVDETSYDDKINMSACLNKHGFENFSILTNNDILDSEIQSELTSIIIVNKKYMPIFRLLKQGYYIQEESSGYVYMVKEKQDSEYSKGEYIKNPCSLMENDVFSLEKKLQLPDGIYEIVLNAEAKTDGNLTVLVMDGIGNTIERPLEEGENLLMLIGGINNISFSINSSSTGNCKIDISAVKLISERGQIFYPKDLNTDNGALLEDLLVSNGEQPTIFYGPYCPLNTGKYFVEFYYFADSYDNISFDAASGGATELYDTQINTRREGSINITTLAFELDKPVSDMEFRMYLPSGMQAKLQYIIVFPVEDTLDYNIR